jgi:hypothetical protein
VEFDRRFIRDQILKTADPERMGYDHLRAHEEPLLSVPDSIAWCLAHGGHCRVARRPLPQLSASLPRRPPGSLSAASAADGFRLRPPATARNRLTLLRRLACPGPR